MSYNSQDPYQPVYGIPGCPRTRRQCGQTPVLRVAYRGVNLVLSHDLDAMSHP